MIYYSKQAELDLDEILDGLLNWEKIILTREYCVQYVSDIIDVCDALDKEPIHLDTTYSEHKQYGTKVYKYARNKHTVWYIIYNIDPAGNIFINKIINNYQTIQ